MSQLTALGHQIGFERSGAKVLLPSARGVKEGALVGAATRGASRETRFSADLMRRHRLYVARTLMGKSTLMRHAVVHKMREKAAGRDDDAIVVMDPHAGLVEALLEHVPESLIDSVRLIDLADEERMPGINLLDTAVFADRDRTADSVVRVCKGLWEQWGPMMQSILEHTVKTLHRLGIPWEVLKYDCLLSWISRRRQSGAGAWRHYGLQGRHRA